jgi:hypothetical protein
MSAEEPERFLMHCFAVERAGHERAGKSPAETHTLGAIEIAAACLAPRPQPLQLALVYFPKLVLRARRGRACAGE